MKKTILALAVCGVLASATAYADGGCEGGTEITGENGYTYCQSTAKMTWWAAFAWCEHQGRHLASMQEACNGWTYSMTNGNVCPGTGTTVPTCPNIKGKIIASTWTATPTKTSTSVGNLACFLYTTGVVNNNHRNSDKYTALCY